MNVFSFAFVDTSLFAATLTLKYGRHFADDTSGFRRIILRAADDLEWDADVEQIDRPLMAEWPAAGLLMREIEGRISEYLSGQNLVLGKVYLEEIRPNGFLGWNVARSPYDKAHSRFRLLAGPCAGGAWFSGGDSLQPGVGNLTFFNHHTLHSIINLGPVPQVSLVVDVRRPALQ